MSDYKKLGSKHWVVSAAVAVTFSVLATTATASESVKTPKPVSVKAMDESKHPVSLFSSAQASEIRQFPKNAERSAKEFDAKTPAYTAVIWLFGTLAISLLLLSRERKE